MKSFSGVKPRTEFPAFDAGRHFLRLLRHGESRRVGFNFCAGRYHCNVGGGRGYVTDRHGKHSGGLWWPVSALILHRQRGHSKDIEEKDRSVEGV